MVGFLLAVLPLTRLRGCEYGFVVGGVSSVVVRYSTAHTKLSVNGGRVGRVRMSHNFRYVKCGCIVQLSNAMRINHSLAVSKTRYGDGKFSNISCGGRSVNVYCINNLSTRNGTTSAQAPRRGGTLTGLVGRLYKGCRVIRILKRHSASPSLSNSNVIRPRR